MVGDVSRKVVDPHLLHPDGILCQANEIFKLHIFIEGKVDVFNVVNFCLCLSSFVVPVIHLKGQQDPHHDQDYLAQRIGGVDAVIAFWFKY